MKIIFCGLIPALVRAFRENNQWDVEVVESSIMDVDAEAYVSPGNSFGFMDGGIDALYTKHYGVQLEETLKSVIKDEWYGELPVGSAEGIWVGENWIIAAPTMRVPMRLPEDTINPYLATKAALAAAKDLNLKSIAFPGMGTGVGGVEYANAVNQMNIAVGRFLNRHMPTDWRNAQADHLTLYPKGMEQLKTALESGKRPPDLQL